MPHRLEKIYKNSEEVGRSEINAFIYLRICCYFHACIAFHALKCKINILITFFYFTTLISVKEYYCNTITPILDN